MLTMGYLWNQSLCTFVPLCLCGVLPYFQALGNVSL